MRIGFFGIQIGTVNYGVAALAYSQLAFIDKCVKKNNIEAEYHIFSQDTEKEIQRIKKELGITNKVTLSDPARIRTGLKGYRNLYKEIKKCDIIFDITQGDSFSDIYGMKRYLLQSFEKKLTIKARKKLVLMPQTIGPFYKGFVKRDAKKILNKSDIVFARDEISQNLVDDLVNRKKANLTCDIAFTLPYTKAEKENSKRKVGLNISGLMWNGGYNQNNQFGLKLSYQKLTEDILAFLLKDENTEVHLISHVYSEGTVEDDYAVCKKIKEKYPECILAPHFKTPVEAKSYISGMDVFMGGRMHATIAAFSSGVITIPISYSRKFEGLYNSIDYDYCVNCRELTNEQALNRIVSFFGNLEKLKKDGDNSRNIIDRKIGFLEEKINQIILDK